MPDPALNSISNSERSLFLLLLSVAAGCVDAIAFLSIGIFPANMTGNSVVLASSLLHPVAGGAWLSGLALIGFSAGAASGSWIVLAPKHEWSPRVSIALLCAGLLVSGSTVALLLTGDHFLWAIVIAASAAMGLQSAAVQQLGMAGVATVFVTGTLTTAIGRLVGRAQRPGFTATAEENHWLPALSWTSYFVGAFIGGAQAGLHLPILVALPGLLLLGIAIVSSVRLRRS
ncbi:MAG TPA: YoaK family protein [Chthoniobacterales bacterium]|nr:YoaK family protein [Chthoniobacterales bacterium]